MKKDIEYFRKIHERKTKDEKWKRDVESYARYVEIYKISITDISKNFALKNIRRIEQKYPGKLTPFVED